jgi:hypothetical protein
MTRIYYTLLNVDVSKRNLKVTCFHILLSENENYLILTVRKDSVKMSFQRKIILCYLKRLVFVLLFSAALYV